MNILNPHDIKSWFVLTTSLSEFYLTLIISNRTIFLSLLLINNSNDLCIYFICSLIDLNCSHLRKKKYMIVL